MDSYSNLRLWLQLELPPEVWWEVEYGDGAETSYYVLASKTELAGYRETILQGCRMFLEDETY